MMRVDYELPIAKHATGVTKTLLGGWQANTIAFWLSGEPFSWR